MKDRKIPDRRVDMIILHNPMTQTEIWRAKSEGYRIMVDPWLFFPS